MRFFEGFQHPAPSRNLHRNGLESPRFAEYRTRNPNKEELIEMNTDKYTVYQVADPRVHLVKMVRNSDGAERWLTRSTYVSMQESPEAAFELGNSTEEMQAMQEDVVRTEETPFGMKTRLKDGSWVLGRVLPDGSRAYHRGGGSQ